MGCGGLELLIVLAELLRRLIVRGRGRRVLLILEDVGEELKEIRVGWWLGSWCLPCSSGACVREGGTTNVKDEPIVRNQKGTLKKRNDRFFTLTAHNILNRYALGCEGILYRGQELGIPCPRSCHCALVSAQ